ncbi:TonB-dependent receptor [Paracidobacterium acidisoli]|uniref:TonB-dependent receptor n=1 Tax=Paracidobacterium acidisoli TaxID=2303751 RepID=A0A372IRC2_9BACT|nr:carboxypeptidase-like regulatory domain-containing protein [Paracidobacterium acidisoli]MBT9330188.1 TonB-dependent receptor [Paracidobacterium acidisoli]
MKDWLKACILLMFAMTAVTAAMAQTSIVSGQVVDGAKKPVAGIRVRLINPSLPYKEVVTDENGVYTFEDVPPLSDYSVEVMGKITIQSIAFEVPIDNPKLVLPDIVYEEPAVPAVAAQAPVQASSSQRATAPAPSTASGGITITANPVQNSATVQPLPVRQNVSKQRQPAVQPVFLTSLGVNVSGTQLRVLPLYNRNFLALGNLSPGVHDVPQGSALEGAAFSISGSPPYATNFLIDGHGNIASSTDQAIPFQVNEGIQEFRITYANQGAQYGGASGGVVDVVTSRGRGSQSGAWHGSIFGYYNSDSLNAGSPISAYSGTTFAKAVAYAGPMNSPTYTAAGSYSAFDCISDVAANCASPNLSAVDAGTKWLSFAPTTYNAMASLLGSGLIGATPCGGAPCGNFQPWDAAGALAQYDSRVLPVQSRQFGANLGGPLLSRRVFLFASYEGTLINNANPIFERVPTGTDLANAAANDNTGLASRYLGLYPKANITGGGSSSGGWNIFNFYRGTAPNFTHVHNVLVRPDIILPHEQSLSLRYTGQILDQLHDDNLPAQVDYAGNGAERFAQNQSAALSLSGRLFGGASRYGNNELRIGFTQFRLDELPQDRHSGANAYLPTFVLSGVDSQYAGAKSGTPGAFGGWFDSFWASCGGTVGSGHCPNYSQPAAAWQSPSPVTPSLDGEFPMARLGAPLVAPSQHRDSEFQLYDLLSLKLTNRHIFNVGGDLRYNQNFLYDGSLTRGLVVSNNLGEFTSDSETCISCGKAFVRPSFDYALRQPTPYIGDLRSWTGGVFAEDRFTPNRKLLITLGVRYEYFGQPLEQKGRLWNYINSTNGLVREGTTQAFDAFGNACSGAQSSLASVYAAQQIAFSSTGCGQGSPGFNLPTDKTSVAPRFGLAYAPDAERRRVYRIGGGLYYDRLPASYTLQLLRNRPTPFDINAPSALYGQNFASSYCGGINTQCGLGNGALALLSGGVANGVEAAYQVASGAGPLFERDQTRLKNPMVFEYTASIEQQVGRNVVFELAYVGSEGHRHPAIYDSNFLNEFYCQSGVAASNSIKNTCLPNTFFPVFTESNFGYSHYNSFIARVRTEEWHGLSLDVSYAYAKSLDDIAGSQFPAVVDSVWNQLFGRQFYGMGNPAAFGLAANTAAYGDRGQFESGCTAQQCLAQAVLNAHVPSVDTLNSALTTTGARPVITSHYSIPQNPLNLNADYAPSDFDIRQRVAGDFIYNIPSGHLPRLMRDFTLSGILLAEGGQPFTIFAGPAYGQITQMVKLNGPVHMDRNPNGYFSYKPGAISLIGTNYLNGCSSLYAISCLYSSTPQGAGPIPGADRRNSFYGPDYISQDIALQKITTLGTDSVRLVLRGEVYNLFNHANFDNPISNYSPDGVQINPEFGLIRSSHPPRQTQFGARLEF